MTATIAERSVVSAAGGEAMATTTADAPAPPSRTLIALSFFAVYVIWGSTYLAIQYALESLPPFLIAGVRNLIAGSILYAWARLRGAPGPSGRQWAGVTEGTQSPEQPWLSASWPRTRFLCSRFD